MSLPSLGLSIGEEIELDLSVRNKIIEGFLVIAAVAGAIDSARARVNERNDDAGRLALMSGGLESLVACFRTA